MIYYMILILMGIMIKNQSNIHFTFMFFQQCVHMLQMIIIIYFIMFNLIFILIIIKQFIYYQ